MTLHRPYYRQVLRPLILAGLLAALGTGCDKPADEIDATVDRRVNTAAHPGKNGGDGTEAPPMAPMTESPQTATQPGDLSRSQTQRPGNPVEVTLGEYHIRMPSTLPAGITTFAVSNMGEVAHNFEIEGQGLHEKFEVNLNPKQTQHLVVDLRPGQYRVYCPVGNHESRGMVHPLTVTEGQPATQPGQQ